MQKYPGVSINNNKAMDSGLNDGNTNAIFIAGYKVFTSLGSLPAAVAEGMNAPQKRLGCEVPSAALQPGGEEEGGLRPKPRSNHLH